MAKKSLKKATLQRPPEAAARQSGSAYPAQPEELNRQQRRLKKAAAVGAEALKSPAPAVTPALSPAPAVVSPRPTPPVAALWPTPDPATGVEKPTHSATRQPQMLPMKLAAPKTSPAPAAPPVKLPVQWEPPASPRKAAAVEQTVSPPAPLKVKVPFVLAKPEAKFVSLSGDFNGWSANGTPMKQHSPGRWEATIDLPPGRYQYKFIMDGQWIPDPLARENVRNPHGTLNSVVEVRA